MNSNAMNLKILLPFQVLLEAGGLERVVVDTSQGCMGFLPRRLDCVAILIPGILSYQPQGQAPVYVAIDSGVLIKAGVEVSVSVRRAILGPDLAQLHSVVKDHFLNLDDQERQMRTALAKVERGLVQRFREVLYDH